MVRGVLCIHVGTGNAVCVPYLGNSVDAVSKAALKGGGEKG